MRNLIRTGVISLGFVLAVSPAFAFAQSTDVQSQIAALLAQVKQLQALIAQLQGQSGSASACVTLSDNLYAGETDATTNGDVTQLQQFLSVSPATGYFGPMTLQAVQNWQSSHGVVSSGTADTTGYGFVGPQTRAAMACSSTAASTSNSSTPTNTPNTTTNATPAPTTQNTSAAPTITATNASSGNITATYANLPANSQIWIVNASTGQAYTAQSTLVWSGGSGTTNIPVPSSLQSGSYMLRVASYYNQSTTIAQSGSFQAGTASQNTAVISCTLRADPNAVAPGIPTVLSWTSTGATSAQWVADTSGKDNIPPPSGSPATAGSMSFIPLSTLPAGQTSIPTVTLQVSGPGGTATCMTGITVVSSEQAAFDNTVFTQGSSPTPTISGTASGVSQVGVVLSNNGDKAYGSGLIPVVNGHWSVTVSPALATGSYFINVYDANNNGLVNGGSLNVVNPTPAPTCTLTPTSSTPSGYTTGYDYSVKPNSSLTLTWTSQNANYSVWGSGDKDNPSGSMTINNLTAVTNNYSLTFYGNGGSTTCKTAVYVDYKG